MFGSFGGSVRSFGGVYSLFSLERLGKNSNATLATANKSTFVGFISSPSRAFIKKRKDTKKSHHTLNIKKTKVLLENLWGFVVGGHKKHRNKNFCFGVFR